ncbi:hypothetical protein [Demequina sp. NBRC 110051]|uniref:hypothetical protein n=1 Tax=Demequina sp. NBRC 110051 TaxID=1570340 RepID=UPI00117F8E32|nr:hypothetical protein [Demequina sp. NBRC 110051]
MHHVSPHARAQAGAWATGVVGALILTGCLSGPGTFVPPAIPTADASATTEPGTEPHPGATAGGASVAAIAASACGLLDGATLASATGHAMEPTATADDPDSHADALPTCRWVSVDTGGDATLAAEVTIMVDPTITDIDEFVEQATADADAAGLPHTHLAIDGADVAFGGDGEGFAAVVVVFAGVVHQVIYSAPDDANRLQVAERLAEEMAQHTHGEER